MSKPDAQEFLNWFCWECASTAARFYPPEETAAECIDALEIEDEYNKGIEVGKHTRAVVEATEFFRAMERWGFSPVYRADYHARQAEEEHDLEEGCLAVDWSWYEHYVENRKP